MKLSEQLAAMAGDKPNKTAAEQAAEVEQAMASVPTVRDVPADMQDVADELAALHQQKKQIEERVNALKQQVLAAVDAGTLSVGDKVETSKGQPAFDVRISGRTFDDIKAASVLPEAVITSISTMRIDPKVAKAKLPPSLYTQCLKDGRASVTLR